jgi:hypothetical protein
VDNYKDIIENIFGKIIKKYDFNLVEMSNHEIFLVGKRFAIAINISHEGSSIYYIIPNEDGEVIEYWFNNFICSKFDSKDREKFGKPEDNNERILAELKVTASGILSHWDNMLNGDRSWIDEYKKYEFGGDARKADVYDTNVLKPIFDKQTRA